MHQSLLLPAAPPAPDAADRKSSAATSDGRRELTRRHLEPPAAVARALVWIELHLYEPISLAALATAAGLSRFHFHRLFRSAMRLTPRTYVMQRRIAEAKHLIRGGVRPAEAAYLLHFADQSHFTRRFKSAVGVTPRRFAAAAVDAGPTFSVSLRERLVDLFARARELEPAARASFLAEVGSERGPGGGAR